MDDLKNDIINELELSSKIVVPEKEVEFLKFLSLIHKSIPRIDSNNIQLWATQFKFYIEKKLDDIHVNYPQFDEPRYFEYFHSIYKTLWLSFVTNETISSEAKLHGIKEIEEWKKNIEFIEPIIKGTPEYENFVNYVQLNKISLQSDEAPNANPASQVFDKVVIEKIDFALRKDQWIDKDSASLFEVLQEGNWINNTHCINWKKKQQSLLYLFHLLNNNEREIPLGTITQLISKTFRIKGKAKDDATLSKSLSIFCIRYIKTNSRKPQELMDIKNLYDAACLNTQD